MSTLSDLLWYLDNVPLRQRTPKDPQVYGLSTNALTVYHITAPENVDSIKANGIKAKSSRQSYDRPNAVYFFAARTDINPANIAILGLADGYRVITVTIPFSAVIEHMVWDGLYNATFTSSYSAVQYLGDIPATWITSIA